jgi:hypothetical protein
MPALCSSALTTVNPFQGPLNTLNELDMLFAITAMTDDCEISNFTGLLKVMNT